MKKAVFALFALTLLAACEPSDKAKQDAVVHTQLGREYLLAGNNDKAMAEAEAALSANSANSDAAFLKADILAHTGNAEEALQMIESASAKLPAEEGFKKDYWLGAVHLQEGDLGKALEHFKAAAAAKPDFVEVWPLLAQTHAKMGNLPDAIATYEKWTALAPGDERAWNQLGIAYVWVRQFDKSRAALGKALELNPKSGLAYNYLGALAVEMGQPKEAEAHFRRSIELFPGNIYAHLNLAQLLMQANRHKEAFEPLSKALELQPGNEYAHFLMAKYHAREKNYPAAVGHYEQALAKDPMLWAARTGIATAALKANAMFDRARAALEEGIAKDPHNQKGYYYYLARLDLAVKQYEAALKNQERAASLVEKEDALALADSHLLRGEILDAMNDPAGAKKEYRTAAKLAPGTDVEKDARKRLAR